MSDKPRDADKPATTDETRRSGGKRGRTRKEAAAAKISPAMPSTGAAILADTDPALDTESETKANLERATGRDRMTGES